MLHRSESMPRRSWPPRLCLVIVLVLTWGSVGFAIQASSEPAPLLLFNAEGRVIGEVDSSGVVTRRIGGPSPSRPISDQKAGKRDKDLERGFPVSTLHTGGSFAIGPGINTLVGNIDSDPELEIIAAGLAEGPLYAWNHDGTPVDGWPVDIGTGAGYLSLGRLGPHPWRVFGAFFGCATAQCERGSLAAISGTGEILPGWPISVDNYVSSPAVLESVLADGRDEIFLGEEDWYLHGYSANSAVLPGWPVRGDGGQRLSSPAISDLDGDGDLEVLTASESISGVGGPVVSLFAFHHTGTPVFGFPARSQSGASFTYLSVGDVDGDGKVEIVTVTHGLIKVYASNGGLKRTMPLQGQLSYGTAPALGDLDGDGRPEIVVQTDGTLNAYHGDGRRVKGWPVTWSKTHWAGNSAPVIGDVDGDGKPDVVVTSMESGQSERGEVGAYNTQGKMLKQFPKKLPLGWGSVPAIADIDRDGRNELVVCGDFWNGIEGVYARCWAYDFRGKKYGKIEWGQFGGDASHTGRYPVPAPP